MRARTMIALAAAVVAVPAAAYYFSIPHNDPIGDTLRGYGYVPLRVPSNLMKLGSLYYVDSNLKDFTTICDADDEDLGIDVHTSRSMELQESLERNGQLATGISIDLGWMLKGDLDKNYIVKVKSSLTDVMLEEISLGPNWVIFGKLMSKPYCSRMAMQYIHAGGYVCQLTKILHATAEYKLDRDAETKLATNSTATSDGVKDIVKLAVESQANQAVVDKQGRLFAGKALEYGVTLTPICLAPPNARFQRVLPYTAFGRAINYLLFNILEPILPPGSDRLEVAQDTTSAQGPK
ncbi:MAG: hypothetical protein JWP25_4418 [Bradyrhizobium sp.]|nr:hypothetical protein [Bradyrhizobium sp.]